MIHYKCHSGQNQVSLVVALNQSQAFNECRQKSGGRRIVNRRKGRKTGRKGYRGEGKKEGKNNTLASVL